MERMVGDVLKESFICTGIVQTKRPVNNRPKWVVRFILIVAKCLSYLCVKQLINF